jgi:hypothetical protein
MVNSIFRNLIKKLIRYIQYGNIALKLLKSNIGNIKSPKDIEILLNEHKYKKVEKNYVVDFVDIDNKVLYEIKPESTSNSDINKTKYRYAKSWCKKNGYKYIVIKDSWFKKNYKEDLVYGQPSEEKILKNLKQFL